MADELAIVMKEFFNNADEQILSSPSGLALGFAEHFIRRDPFNDLPTIELPRDNLNNVCVLSDQISLSDVAKRVPLIADKTVLSHYREEVDMLGASSWRHIMSGLPGTSLEHYYDELHAICEGELDKAEPDNPFNHNTYRYFLRCPDLIELGNWLKDCRPLLTEGDLFYYPDIVVEIRHDTFLPNTLSIDRKETSLRSVADMVVKNRKLVNVLAKSPVKANLVRPILVIDLPCIENISLETFARITTDERKAVEQFRDFLRLRFLDMEHNEGSEAYQANLMKIEVEIRDEVRKLNSDFEMLKNKRAFQVTGATIAATTAVLLSLNSVVFGILPELLGTSGGLLAIVNALQEYSSQERKFKDSPYYYMWILSREAHKVGSESRNSLWNISQHKKPFHRRGLGAS